MRYQHIAALAFDQPLMIEPTKGRIIAHYLATRILGTMVLPDLRGVGEVRPARREGLQVENGIALIDVSGVLVNRAGQMDADSAPLLSYEQLTSELEAAAADASIRGILLRLDSPGGEVGGVFDLAQRIRQVEKPIWGIAAAQACSAAYLLGCATQRFFTSQEATTGSIGVVLNRFDVTKALDADGIQVIQIAAGARKLDRSEVQPWKPGSKEEKALVAYVTSFYDLFVNAVATYRGLSAAAVRETDAGLFVGQASVGAQLVDEVGTIRGTLKKFAESLNNQNRSLTMSAQAHDTAPLATPPAAAAAAPAAATPTPEQLRREGADAERQRIERISALALPGYEQLATKAKADGTSAADFAVAQVEEQKKKSKAKLTAIRDDESQMDKPAPGVSGDAGGEDEDKTVASMIGLHRAMRGQSPVSGASN